MSMTFDFQSHLSYSAEHMASLQQDGEAESLIAASAAKGGTWMDTILNLIPGRRAAASSEPSEEAIKRTHDNLRQHSWHI